MLDINPQHIISGIIAGPVGAALSVVTSKPTKSSFVNVPNAPPTGTSIGFVFTIIIILGIIIGILYISSKAVYNLTDSIFQVIMYLLFGVFYLWYATLYYGLSGYKYKLSNINSNSRN